MTPNASQKLPVAKPIYEVMAEAIVETIDKIGHCGTRELRERGFSYDDIARHWPDACEIAEATRPRVLYRAK